jgi:hypothetical protein
MRTPNVSVNGMSPLTAALVLAGLVVFFFIVQRMNELFLLSVRNGQVIVVRGRVPPGFLRDVRMIVRGLPKATIRGIKSDGHARITGSGLDERVMQRLRNAFGHHPASRLRAAPPIARPNFGQVLGIVWLAWLLDGMLRRDA